VRPGCARVGSALQGSARQLLYCTEQYWVYSVVRQVAAYRAKINAPGKDPLVVKTFNPQWTSEEEAKRWVQRTFPNGNITLQTKLARVRVPVSGALWMRHLVTVSLFH